MSSSIQLTPDWILNTTIVEHSSDYIGLASFDGTMLFLNASGRELVGLDSDSDVTSKSIADFHFEEHQALHQSIVLPAIARAGRWDGSTELRHTTTGASIAVLANCFEIHHPETGKPFCLGIILQEVNRELHSSEALRISEERLSLTVRAATDGLWDCDLVEGTVWWNEAYDVLYGTRPKDTEQSWQWWVDRIHPDDRERVSNSLELAARSTADYGDRWTDEYKFRKADREFAHVVDRAFISRNAAGEATRILGAMQDVTALRHFEQSLVESNAELHAANRKLNQALADLKLSECKIIQQERQGAIGEMACGIAHNLNNMLLPAVLLVDLVLNETDLPEHVRSWVTTMQTGTSDAAELVKQLGSLYGNPNSQGQKEPVDMRGMLEQIPTLTRTKWQDEALKNGLEITVELAVTDSPEVDGYPSDLRQVLTNLVINAVDAMPSGGTIYLGLSVENDTVIVEVKDDGIGMSVEQTAKCFEPFFTTKSTGSGLGLSMCYNSIAKHSGALSVKSKVGEGTAFRIELPLATQQIPPAEEVQTGPLTRRYRILYVDDQPIVSLAFAEFLKSLGHQVTSAENGTDGIDTFQKNEFDVVITDYSMPGMNGRSLAAAIKTLSPDMPVILLTGWPIDQMADSGEAPESCILQKPVSAERLSAALREYVMA